MKTQVLTLLVSVLMLTADLGHLRAEPSLETDLEDARARLADFDQSLDFHQLKSLKQASKRDRNSLTPDLRVKFDQREDLKEAAEDFEKMEELKRRLLDLPGREDFEKGDPRLQRQSEAEDIARTVVPAFGELRREYAMVRPAIFHNLLVNVGLKKQGFCWHWARDLTNRLRVLHLRTFDLLWATARGGTMREHNTVVLVSRGHLLEDGLLLDGWRHAGEPFWMRVTDDKSHPWKLGQYYGGR
jgi:hypothetical protein